ncbi:hypothetical protein PGQ11_006993 [Apiospora arundinis]|uniref:Ecp2 effector protein domain-containing protein n=1 Tax=Apiospora arundinis TaxID=335852 RepID=A0ABR2IUB3_9PEZI
MQLKTIFFTLMAAGTNASPIEARQLAKGSGKISLYSEHGCRGAIAENVAITSDCTTLNETATSIKFLSYYNDGFVIWGLDAFSDTQCRFQVAEVLPPDCTFSTVNNAQIKSVNMRPGFPF